MLLLNQEKNRLQGSQLIFKAFFMASVLWGLHDQLALAEVVLPVTAVSNAQQASNTPAAVSAQELKEAQDSVKSNPQDGKAHFNLAEIWRRMGKDHLAASEYLQAVKYDSGMLIAFHQLSVIQADDAQIDEAIACLNQLKDKRPQEVLVRVALSELMERRFKYYQAARVLVDLVYQNAVPVKYQSKVNTRIHYLLAKAKEAQDQDKGDLLQEEMDTVPPALPENSQRRSLTAARIREPRVMRGVGHAPLLP